MVRAEVPDAELRTAFDAWYEHEHLRDAREGLGAVRAWRGWSRLQPAVHFAFYEFPDAARAQAAATGQGAGGNGAAESAPAANRTVFKSDWDKTPRNAPCPCGSGKKYKLCHGKN